MLIIIFLKKVKGKEIKRGKEKNPKNLLKSERKYRCWFTLFVTSDSIIILVFKTCFTLIFCLFISTVFNSYQCSLHNFLAATLKITWAWLLLEEFQYSQRKGIMKSLLSVIQNYFCSLSFHEKQNFTSSCIQALDGQNTEIHI